MILYIVLRSLNIPGIYVRKNLVCGITLKKTTGLSMLLTYAQQQMQQIFDFLYTLIDNCKGQQIYFIQSTLQTLMQTSLSNAGFICLQCTLAQSRFIIFTFHHGLNNILFVCYFLLHSPRERRSRSLTYSPADRRSRSASYSPSRRRRSRTPSADKHEREKSFSPIRKRRDSPSFLDRRRITRYK